MAIEIVLPAFEVGRWVAGFVCIGLALTFGMIAIYAIKERDWIAIIFTPMTILFVIALLTIWEFLVWNFV